MLLPNCRGPVSLRPCLILNKHVFNLQCDGSVVQICWSQCFSSCHLSSLVRSCASIPQQLEDMWLLSEGSGRFQSLDKVTIEGLFYIAMSEAKV